jgi:hypothetical protein
VHLEAPGKVGHVFGFLPGAGSGLRPLAHHGAGLGGGADIHPSGLLVSPGNPTYTS